MAAHARLDDPPSGSRLRLVDAVSGPATAPHLLITVALSVSCCLHGFAASSIATAVPVIGRALHAGVGGGEALVTAFFLGAAFGVIAAGRIADVFGARRVLVAGLVVVLLVTLASGLASTLPELVAARLTVGVATASLYPAAIRMLAHTNTRRGLAVTMGLPSIVAASELMFGIGPAAGGALVTAFGWRVACMVLAIPAAAAIVLVYKAFPAEIDCVGAPGAVRRRVWSEVDPAGLALAIAVAATAAAVLVVPIRLSSPTMVLPTALLALIAALVVHSQHRMRPAIDLTVLSSRPILLGLGRTATVYVAVYAVVYGLPLWLADRGWTAEQSGAALLPVAALSVGAVAMFRGAVRDRGPVPPLLAGAGSLVLVGTGMLAMPTFPVSGTAAAVLGVLALLGVTCGAANLATQHGSVAASPLSRAGGVASWSRLIQFVAGQGTTVVVVQALPGTDVGLRALAVGVVALGLLLAVTTAISPTSQGDPS
ncbi:MFS transporter [Kutzneria sp. 744]|uniref:MFS transporter n=1 Tax=Kutzneria sp. (strain 744) TaxID=345341 RepID=UPI0003EEACBD|nr:MFS transporter [Kutzneria sp. 744]EWM19777.1 major facilitator superfamily transporter [Kutzneria sp. 744]